ncbi:MAG: UDP-N-acetylmuramoyl-tripeptide--D-alanyl-D-alanine ligase [Oribacterium sp.]
MRKEKGMETADRSFGFSDEGIERIVLDSRQDSTNGLFVPIIGEKSDGHDYIEMAIRNGARAVLSSRDCGSLAAAYPAVRFYPVEDTRRALQEIGLMERRRFPGTVIGVTGSVGKTTTRSMIAAALSAERRVFQTAGNANSQVGVPVTLFQMRRSGAELAVIELGMSEPGEMTRIARIACVDIAVITNIGTAHIENLKTQENILREKLHILDGMRDGGLLLLNAEDPLLSGVTRETLSRFGIAEGREIRICRYRPEKEEAARPKLLVRGYHMQQNAAAALRIASELGVSETAARQALAQFGGLQGRGEIFTTKGGVTIIDDAYNASPASMRAGLSVLSELRGERKIAVLADMLELGEREESYHRELGKLISELHIDVLFLYGRLAALIGESVQQYGDTAGHKPAISYFTDLTELRNTVCSVAHTGDVLLFKGSNSMRLSDIVSELRKERE